MGASTTINLDPSSTKSTASAPTLYKISWGDGQTSSSLTAAIATHTYTTGGTYKVTLTVSDNANNTNTVTKSVIATAPSGSLYDGTLSLTIPVTNNIVGLVTEMDVPTKPDPVGGLGIWPGLQPDPAGKSGNFNVLGRGLLQPIMGWGITGCNATTPDQANYGTWWVEGYYMNTGATSVTTCGGGSLMSVNPGDHLKLSMTLTGTVWTQLITNITNGKTVSYARDLLGQDQTVALFAIEEKGKSTGAGLIPIIYKNTVITLGNPQSGNWCDPHALGKQDVMTAPIISTDTKTCNIDSITLTPGPDTFRS
jgi:PKD repeat protein